MRALRTQYKGIWFRSKLEAQWAKLLDHFQIKWDYEPVGYRFSDGTMYLPDFWLPESRTWLEVKGVMDQTDMHKVEMLLRESGRPVVIGYSMGQFRACDMWPDAVHNAEYELASMEDSVLIQCTVCGSWSFIGVDGGWSCRCCGAYDGNGHIGWRINNDVMYKVWNLVARIDVRQSYEWRGQA